MSLLIASCLGLAAALLIGPRHAEAPQLRTSSVKPIRVELNSDTVALVMELTAAGLAAGSALPTCLQLAADTLGVDSLRLVSRRIQLGAEPGSAWEGTEPEWEPLRHTVVLVEASGVAATALLREAAVQLRDQAQAQAAERAAALGVRLVLPLGLCALPAFVAWAVVPVILALGERLG